MANSNTLAKVKTHLRISHNVLDEDLVDTIDACLADLETCGVVVPAEDDPLILGAVKVYCRKEYTDDTAKAAEYQKRYDAMKASLMMAEGYREVPADE
jgi:hypothetical protein